MNQLNLGKQVFDQPEEAETGGLYVSHWLDHFYGADEIKFPLAISNLCVAFLYDISEADYGSHWALYPAALHDRLVFHQNTGSKDVIDC